MNSADTADQMMKMTLEGIQVAAEIGLKAGGTAAKSLAVTLYAIITDNKKIKGKTNLDVERQILHKSQLHFKLQSEYIVDRV